MRIYERNTNSKETFSESIRRFVDSRKFADSHRSHGFTLLETLIYAILISFTIGGSLVAVYNLINSSDSLNQMTIIEEEANFALKKIEWALTGLPTVQIPAVGSSGNQLRLDNHSLAITFDLDTATNSLRINDGSGVEPLTSSRVMITNLNFTNIAPNGDTPGAIRTSFDLTPINSSAAARHYEMLIYFKK